MSACRWRFLLPVHLTVVGFDINTRRVEELQQGVDRTGETLGGDLKNSNISFTADPKALRECRYIVVAVPTPVDKANVPDLEPVISASRLVGENLSKGSIVIFESTVYPGVTDEVCLPILEEKSGLKLGDFKIGYSPERINPGDHEHTVDKIVKIVSGCDAETLEEVGKLYSLVAKGVYHAPSIATAEAAKVIENIQRDLNIALMNELSLIFRAPRPQHRRGPRRRGHQMEFPQVSPRPRGWTLHRRRSVLSHLSRATIRLSSAGDSGGSADQ